MKARRRLSNNPEAVEAPHATAVSNSSWGPSLPPSPGRNESPNWMQEDEALSARNDGQTSIGTVCNGASPIELALRSGREFVC